MTSTATTPAPAAPVDLKACPSCDGHVLFTVVLDYGAAGGYAPDHFGVVPEQGDTITRCDQCAAWFVHTPDGAVAGLTDQPAAPAAEQTTPTDEPDDQADELETLKEQVATLTAELAAKNTAPAPETPQEPAAAPETSPWAQPASDTPPTPAS